LVENDNSDEKEGILRTILMVAIVCTIVFVILVSYLGLLVYLKNPCGSDLHTDYKNGVLQNSSYVLNHNNDYVIQRIRINNTENVNYIFCFKAVVQSSSGHKVEIIDEWDNILGINFVDNNTNTFCSEIKEDYIKRQLFIGVRCVNCDSNNNITLMSEILGKDIPQIYYSNGDISTYTDDTLGYTVIGFRSCVNYIKTFTFWWIFVLVMLGLMVLVFVGYGKFKDLLFKDWG